jgi:aldose 1-epimerase
MPTPHHFTDRAVPSGAQAHIASGQHEAVIVEVGGGIRSYRVAGRDVLDGYGIDERCLSARGQPLIPWPNRLHEGRYDWDGQQYQTPINEVAKHNALHGYTRFLNWVVATTTPNEAVARLRLHPQQGYPFILDLSITYTLDPAGLTVTNTARNAGTEPCPYAHGAHPYITVGTDLIDAATLKAPGRTYLPTDESQIPVGREAVDGTPFDFRAGRGIGTVQIDHAFTDLTRGDDGLARVEMTSSETGRTVSVWVDERYPYLMLFTGDTIPDAPRRRRGLGVEPMTCPPNAFATGEDVMRLEPGESITTRWGIVVEDR